VENRIVLEHYELFLVQAIVERLNLLLHYSFTGLESPVDLVRAGLIDACKVFVKGEPHKLSKLVEGRLRLIFSVGFVDNMIARLLCMKQNQAEILNWKDIPAKAGMGLHDEGLRAILKTVFEGDMNGDLAEIDMKGWDWSVQEFEILADLERRIDLNRSRGTLWERIARAHFYCMSRKVFVLSDGTMYQQTIPGVMPSGWYNTSSTNTSIRVLDHYYVAYKLGVIPFIIAMGDDSVERRVAGLKEEYEKLGKTCGQYKEIDASSFEFCSTKFDCGLGYPVNIDKQLVNLLCKLPPTFQDALGRMKQFEYEMRHHPNAVEILQLVADSGWWDEIPQPMAPWA